jgi:hypothetical protein
MTLKPGCPKHWAAAPSSSGTMRTLSDMIPMRVSWISGAQRVISSKRTTRPSSRPR